MDRQPVAVFDVNGTSRDNEGVPTTSSLPSSSFPVLFAARNNTRTHRRKSAFAGNPSKTSHGLLRFRKMNSAILASAPDSNSIPATNDTDVSSTMDIITTTATTTTTLSTPKEKDNLNSRQFSLRSNATTNIPISTPTDRFDEERIVSFRAIGGTRHSSPTRSRVRGSNDGPPLAVIYAPVPTSASDKSLSFNNTHNAPIPSYLSRRHFNEPLGLSSHNKLKITDRTVSGKSFASNSTHSTVSNSTSAPLSRGISQSNSNSSSSIKANENSSAFATVITNAETISSKRVSPLVRTPIPSGATRVSLEALYQREIEHEQLHRIQPTIEKPPVIPMEPIPAVVVPSREPPLTVNTNGENNGTVSLETLYQRHRQQEQLHRDKVNEKANRGSDDNDNCSITAAVVALVSATSNFSATNSTSSSLQEINNTSNRGNRNEMDVTDHYHRPVNGHLTPAGGSQVRYMDDHPSPTGQADVQRFLSGANTMSGPTPFCDDGEYGTSSPVNPHGDNVPNYMMDEDRAAWCNIRNPYYPTHQLQMNRLNGLSIHHYPAIYHPYANRVQPGRMMMRGGSHYGYNGSMPPFLNYGQYVDPNEVNVIHEQYGCETMMDSRLTQQTWKRPMIRVTPTQRLPYVGSEETIESFCRGHVIETNCTVCSTFLYCINSATLVLCPNCESISEVFQLENNQSRRNIILDESVGVGLTVDHVTEVMQRRQSRRRSM